ncbi:hypothetical protein I3N19_002531 [Listeria monocytogenes]|nr:hypothetical protein [Listeria monocytogenes]
MLTILNRQRTTVGVLSNDMPFSCPFWDDERNEKLENFDDTYTVTIPAEHEMAEHIHEGNYILFEDEQAKLRLFRIYEAENGLNMQGRYIKATAENAFIYDLNATIISNKVLTDIRADMALEYILQQTGWSIGKREFVGQIRTIEFADNITAQAGLQQVISEYKAEIDAYVESFGGQIINYKFDLVDERGNNTAKRFEYARDIQGLKRITTDKTMYTALIPIGKDGLTIKSVNDGLNYIYDDEANWLYNDGREYLKGVITKDTITNAQALKDWAQLELEKVNHPLSTYEVDVILLAEMLGYEPHQVTLGDTVRVVDLDMDITLSARIIEKTTSFSDPSKNKVVLGDYIELENVTPLAIWELQAQIKEAKKQIEETKTWKVELFSTSGSTFKNNVGTTQLIARVYDGKTNITNSIERGDFIWEKINNDGTHDLVWEDAQIGVGNVVNISGEDVFINATIRCSVNQGSEASILMINEGQGYLFAELPREFPAGVEVNLSVMQCAQIDVQNGYIYWSQEYYGSKKSKVGGQQSYNIYRTTLDGTFVDMMWVLGGGHGTMFGVDTSSGEAYIWSYYVTPLPQAEKAIAMFKYVPFKEQFYDDSMAFKLEAPDGFRVTYDQTSEYVVMSPGVSNLTINVCKKSDLFAGRIAPLYTFRTKDCGFTTTLYTLQGMHVMFPYAYLSAGGSFTGTDKNQLWCWNMVSNSLVYHHVFQQKYYPAQGSTNECEGAYPFLDANGKRMMQLNLGQGDGGKRYNRIYVMPEERMMDDDN